MSSGEAEARYPYPTEDPTTIETAKSQLRDIASLLSDVGADVDDDALQLSRSWDSNAGATAVYEVENLATMLPADAETVGRVLAPVGDYVAGLEDARAGIDQIRETYDDAVRARSAADARIPDDYSRFEREQAREGNGDAFTDAVSLLDKRYDQKLTEVEDDRRPAVKALRAAIGVLAPLKYRDQGSPGGIGAASFTASTLRLSLVGPVDAPFTLRRRATQQAAFVEVFGRPPVGATDWQTAAILDPTAYASKYEGVPAAVEVGRIEPQPGRGLVRIGLYIPSEEVFNVPNYDLGDDRGMDSSFDPGQTRVALYVDYENGVVVARQNPSVTTEGEVEVGDPSVKVQQTADGQVRLQYDAANPFAPPGANLSGHTVDGDIVVDRTGAVHGTIGDYPAFEAYHDDPVGRTRVVLQDAADNEGSFGPFLQLPVEHQIGEGEQVVNEEFRVRRDVDEMPYPRYPYPTYPIYQERPATELGDPDSPPAVEMVP